MGRLREVQREAVKMLTETMIHPPGESPIEDAFEDSPVPVNEDEEMLPID